MFDDGAGVRVVYDTTLVWAVEYIPKLTVKRKRKGEKAFSNVDRYDKRVLTEVIRNRNVMKRGNEALDNPRNHFEAMHE